MYLVCNLKTFKSFLFFLFSLSIHSFTNAQTAYIPHNEFDVDLLTILDIPTNTIIGTIEICNRGSSVAITPDESKVFVACSEANEISVIETTNNTVIETIQLNYAVDGLSVSHDGERLYISNNLGGIKTLNTNTFEEQASININTSVVPLSPVETHDASRLYVPHHYDNAVGVYDLQTNSLITSIDLLNPYAPNAVVISDDDETVWVSCDGIISKIDAITNTVIEDFYLLNTYLSDLALHPDGTKLYTVDSWPVNLEGSQSLYVLDTESGEVINTIFLGDLYQGIDISPDGNWICVTSINGNKVSLIDANDNSITTTIPISPKPYALGEFIISSSLVSGLDILTNVPGIISISPNPAVDNLMVSFGDTPSDPTLYVIYNTLGQILKKGFIENGLDAFSINTSALNGGAYILAIHGEGWVLNEKIVINEK